MEKRRITSTAELLEAGKLYRKKVARSRLGEVTEGRARDTQAILNKQNAGRLQHLIPLRNERMSANVFAFYRGTAAIMAADLAAGVSTGINVMSCGDAHVSNFGFYASPQRTIVFDLNDFDEAAVAPWEWDLKRLATSIVLAGEAAKKDAKVIDLALKACVLHYAKTLRSQVLMSPDQRFFSSLDISGSRAQLPESSRKIIDKALKRAAKKTSERAAKKLTHQVAEGELRFVQDAPTMEALDGTTARQVDSYFKAFIDKVGFDVAQLIGQYQIVDTARRVVGVGSVGTRCALALLQDGDGNALIMQTKEAGASVLEEFGGVRQPAELQNLIADHGQGARVVAMQRVLQAVSDPFLGHLRADGFDLYVRQFHDMKGGIEADTLEDEPFINYSATCALVLARAHSQSANAAMVSGYIGATGVKMVQVMTEFAHAYAELAQADYANFVANIA